MNDLTAKPHILKQVNLSSIRRVIQAKGTATRAEIAQETRISSTTVRSMLTEMLNDGAIESVGYDESSGGRKAERYRFKMDRYYGVAFCITEAVIHCLVVDICGQIVRTEQLPVLSGDIKEPILRFLDAFTKKSEIKSIGLGVPGIVEDGHYLKNNSARELCKVDIRSFLAERYRVPVILENDLNAIAIGFGRCYEKQFPSDSTQNINLAYLSLNKGCISAGFIAGGKIIRGWKNYAGELGLIPSHGERSLAECLAEPMDDAAYTIFIANLIAWICAVLNPEYIVLGGPYLRKECIGPIGDVLYARLPHEMLGEILYAPDHWHDYYEGMAFLTAGKIFDEVQLTME